MTDKTEALVATVFRAVERKGADPIAFRNAQTAERQKPVRRGSGPERLIIQSWRQKWPALVDHRQKPAEYCGKSVAETDPGSV